MRQYWCKTADEVRQTIDGGGTKIRIEKSKF